MSSVVNIAIMFDSGSSKNFNILFAACTFSLSTSFIIYTFFHLREVWFDVFFVNHLIDLFLIHNSSGLIILISGKFPLSILRQIEQSAQFLLFRSLFGQRRVFANAKANEEQTFLLSE